MNLFYRYHGVILIIVFTLLITACAQPDFPGNNLEWVGRWARGLCFDVTINGDTVYYSNGAMLEIVKLSALPETISKLD